MMTYILVMLALLVAIAAELNGYRVERRERKERLERIFDRWAREVVENMDINQITVAEIDASAITIFDDGSSKLDESKHEKGEGRPQCQVNKNC